MQYIRSRAKEWNIDPTRIASYGSSAGAGTSLWLAFHDDLADPGNPGWDRRHQQGRRQRRGAPGHVAASPIDGDVEGLDHRTALGVGGRRVQLGPVIGGDSIGSQLEGGPKVGRNAVPRRGQFGLGDGDRTEPNSVEPFGQFDQRAITAPAHLLNQVSDHGHRFVAVDLGTRQRAAQVTGCAAKVERGQHVGHATEASVAPCHPFARAASASFHSAGPRFVGSGTLAGGDTSPWLSLNVLGIG